MVDMIAHFFRRADFLLQPYFCLVQALFVEAEGEAGDAGIFTAANWGRHRLARTVPKHAHEDRYGSDSAYRRYLDSIHEAKIVSVLSLMHHFDFSGCGRILELGCGDMPQAYTIASRCPGIDYTATDFDPIVIDWCEHLPLLQGIRKRVLDAAAPELDLKDHDLVTSWSLEFSLDDRALTGLFAACKRHRVPYLLCTHAAIGPMSYVSRAQWARKQRALAQRPGARTLGWLRSVGEVARLARSAGMRLEWKAYHVNHAVLYFTP